MHYYSKKEDDFIKNNLHQGNKAIAEVIGRSADSVKNRMRALGIKRSEKQVKALYRANNSGQFSKGQLPHNTNYNGHERITVDGYTEIRLKAGLYRLKHVHNWEKINGPLPKGCCLRCLDGDKQNTQASNWQLITRAENMLKNTIHRYPKPLVKAIRLKSLITKQL